MSTLRSQPIFNPMQTTLFKRAHTATCMDSNDGGSNYDINSMVALSNLFKLNTGNQSTVDDCLLANQQIVSNLITDSAGIPANLESTLLANQTAANSLLDTLANVTHQTTNSNKSTKSDNDEFYDKLQAIYFNQFKQQLQQDLPTALFSLQNTGSSISTTKNSNHNDNKIDLANVIRLATELNQSSSALQSLIQPSNPTNAESIVQQQQSTASRSTKRQKTIPNPIKLTYSNFNREQIQPLDLSVKSASSNSERFILEPLNLSRSNSPEESVKKVNFDVKMDAKKQLNNGLIQSALCKKKKMMIQKAAELLKKSSCSSPPCSPSSIATSSSPSDQPFDLDNSQSNLEICLPLSDAICQFNNNNSKKRKFSDLNDLNLESIDDHQQQQINNICNRTKNRLPKLQAKRRQTNSKSQRKQQFVITNDETIIGSTQSPSTIIIDAKDTFICSICREMFEYRDRLSKHIKSKHRLELEKSGAIQTSQQSANGRNSPNQRSYQCTMCSRSFSRSDMLTRHSRVHSGLKPYTCEICNSEFTRSDHLATHKRTHSGEKPYKYSKCTYTACRRDMITRHMKTHINGSDKGKSTTSLLLLSTAHSAKTQSPTSSEIVFNPPSSSSTTNESGNQGNHSNSSPNDSSTST